MDQTVHFISGLPRSGSTLLSAILRQNPRFHAWMTSPVGAVFNACLTAMGAENEFSVFFKEEQKRDILLGIAATAFLCAGLIEKGKDDGEFLRRCRD